MVATGSSYSNANQSNLAEADFPFVLKWNVTLVCGFEALDGRE